MIGPGMVLVEPKTVFDFEDGEARIDTLSGKFSFRSMNRAEIGVVVETNHPEIEVGRTVFHKPHRGQRMVVNSRRLLLVDDPDLLGYSNGTQTNPAN